MYVHTSCNTYDMCVCRSPRPEDQILSAKMAFEETKAKSSLKFKEKLTEFEE